MNEIVLGQENLHLELDSVKTETEPTIYDDVVAESATPALEQTSYETCSRGALKKRQASADLENACQRDTVRLRRMLFFMSAVAAIALLTAAAAFFLAITAIKGFGGTSAVKSEDEDRIKKVSENITTLDKRMEERMQQVEKRIPDEGLLRNEMDDLRALLKYQTARLDKLVNKISSQLNLTEVSLQSSDAFLFASLIDINTTLTQKVNNISKMAGPIGPPGFNGSQGAAGPMGAIGPPGPKGAENFSKCQYKVEEGVSSPGNPEKAVASKTETTGKIILGATCSTNFAPEHNLISQQQSSGKWKYICNCRGTSGLFSPQRGKTKNCFLHYWECPLAT